MTIFKKLIHYLRRFLYTFQRNMLEPISGGYAACGQDIYVAQLLGNQKHGVFVDIGANDGITISNTLYFEKELGWTGLAVEPLPSIYQKLHGNRTCQKLNACISDTRGKIKFIELVGGINTHMLSTIESNATGLTKRRINKNLKRHGAVSNTIEVDSYPFEDAMQMHGISNIDFLSVDTEGGELNILKSINFKKHSTKVISVENNYYANDIKKFLESKGFSYVGTFKVDEIYINRSLDPFAK